jgi:hypothetical protein
VERIAEVGHHFADADAAGDCYAVPLALAVVSQLVPSLTKHRDRRLGIRQFGLLHQQHIRPRPLEPPGDLL